MKKRYLLAAGALAIATPFVAKWEGKKNEAYLDPVAIPTVCYGYTHGVELGQIYTDEECRGLLRDELERAQLIVNSRVTVRLTAKQEAALISFVYNVGPTNFKRSTLLRKLNAGDYAGACNELPKWKYAKGKVLRGLVRRREAERKLCMEGL